jgi:hypothetical protein
VLIDAQARLLGPLQPAGRVDPRLPDIPNPEIALPSLELKLILTVCWAPTTTETLPATEGVATTKLLLPVGPVLPPIGLPVGPPPVLPVPLVPPPVELVGPLSLLYELDPQPETSNSEQTPRSSERWADGMPLER